MASERPERQLNLVELNERVRAALSAIDGMSEEALRELVRDEPRILVDAAEGIIARRRSDEHLHVCAGLSRDRESMCRSAPMSDRVCWADEFDDRSWSCCR